LAIAAGGALPFQAGINARLATFVGGSIRASAISFAVGTVVLVLLALIATRGVMSTGRLGSVPWWGWLGGAVGAGYVASAVAAVPVGNEIAHVEHDPLRRRVRLQLRPRDRRPERDFALGLPARRVDRARLEGEARTGATNGPPARCDARQVVPEPELSADDSR